MTDRQWRAATWRTGHGARDGKEYSKHATDIIGTTIKQHQKRKKQNADENAKSWYIGASYTHPGVRSKPKPRDGCPASGGTPHTACRTWPRLRSRRTGPRQNPDRPGSRVVTYRQLEVGIYHEYSPRESRNGTFQSFAREASPGRWVFCNFTRRVHNIAAPEKLHIWTRMIVVHRASSRTGSHPACSPQQHDECTCMGVILASRRPRAGCFLMNHTANHYP